MKVKRMNNTELKEMKIFINNVLNIDLNTCQENILKNIVDDRVIGFMRQSDDLIDLSIYKIIYDINYKGYNTFVVNFNDAHLNQLAFDKITRILLELNDEIEEENIIRLDDILIIDEIQIFSNDHTTKVVDSYTLYNIFDNDDILEMVDNIIYDKHQNFLIMDNLTKYVLLNSEYSNILNAHIFSLNFSEYHNCNYEVLQEVKHG